MNKSHHHADESGNQKPSPPEPVWVQCEGYRCLAVLDREGRWRTYHNRAPIHGAIEVLAEPAAHSRPLAQ